MKKTAFIFFGLLLHLFALGQTSFRTLVPQLPVVEGESFRVQYVAENADEVENFLTPVFKGFKMVNDPEVREGKTGLGPTAKRNYNTVYTLTALKPGRYTINGAVATIDGKLMRSNNASVVVISRQDAEQLRKQTDAGDDPSYLRPGEDPYQKIKQNLFVKVQVSKRSCYPGEPVLATFKLFSRLQSSSDIVKNPGFYGFTIYDMVNLADKEKTVEMVNGKLFDVHTIRKVQLYPLQAGQFTIDPMEVHNKVELSRSQVNRKTEQKIVEGLMGGDDGDDSPGNPDAEVFDCTVATEPVTVNVKPIAAKNRPANFSGAIGRFTIESTLEKTELGKNEEGFLVITIKGKGNFTQLSAPSLVWPKGIEGFEPSVKDFLDKTSMPLSGERSFRYAFVSGQPGAYELPAVSYEYYDADSNRYKTISTKPIQVSVSNKEKETLVEQPRKTSITAINKKVSLIAAGIIGLAVIIALIYWLRQKKEVAKEPLQEKQQPVKISVDELLQPAVLMIPAADADFYKALQQAIWKTMEQHFALNGNRDKSGLAALLKKQDTAQADINALMDLLSQCEMGIFTNAELGEPKGTVVENARELLKRVAEPSIAGEA